MLKLGGRLHKICVMIMLVGTGCPRLDKVLAIFSILAMCRATLSLLTIL